MTTTKNAVSESLFAVFMQLLGALLALAAPGLLFLTLCNTLNPRAFSVFEIVPDLPYLKLSVLLLAAGVLGAILREIGGFVFLRCGKPQEYASDCLDEALDNRQEMRRAALACAADEKLFESCLNKCRADFAPALLRAIKRGRLPPTCPEGHRSVLTVAFAEFALAVLAALMLYLPLVVATAATLAISFSMMCWLLAAGLAMIFCWLRVTRTAVRNAIAAQFALALEITCLHEQTDTASATPAH